MLMKQKEKEKKKERGPFLRLKAVERKRERKEEGRTGSGKRRKERKEWRWARRTVCLLSVLCVRGLSFVEEQEEWQTQRRVGCRFFFFFLLLFLFLLLLCFGFVVVGCCLAGSNGSSFLFSFLSESGLGLVGFFFFFFVCCSGPKRLFRRKEEGGEVAACVCGRWQVWSVGGFCVFTKTAIKAATCDKEEAFVALLRVCRVCDPGSSCPNVKC